MPDQPTASGPDLHRDHRRHAPARTDRLEGMALTAAYFVPILFAILVPMIFRNLSSICRNLSKWTGSDPPHSLAMPILLGTALIGLLGVAAYLTVIVKRIAGSRTASLTTLVVLTLLAAMNAALLVIVCRPLL